MSSINYRLNIVIRNDIRKSGPRYKIRRLWSAKNAKKMQFRPKAMFDASR